MKKFDLKEIKMKLADSFISAKEATKKVIEEMPEKAVAAKQIVGEKYEKAKIKIASESTFDGTTEKVEPTLKYFRHEQQRIVSEYTIEF